MHTEKCRRSWMWALITVGLLLFLVWLCGWYTGTVLLTGDMEPENLKTLLTDITGEQNVQIEAAAEEGNLFAVYWSTETEQGLLLLEREDGLFSSGWRVLADTTGDGDLNIWQTSLNDVVTITALFGRNTDGVESCQDGGTGEIRTLEEGCVLELFIQTGGAENPELLMSVN